MVSYIVRSVHEILCDDFGLPDGLADTSTVTVPLPSAKGKAASKVTYPKVLILDPAVGTGTFLHQTIDLIHEHVQGKGLGGVWSDYVSSHLLPRVFGFELLLSQLMC